MMRALLALALLAACSEYRVDDGPRIPPAAPPDDPLDEQGNPPDWQDCQGGYLGRYFNLAAGDPAVGPLAPATPADPADADWWFADDLAYSRFDPTIDFGDNWWPVDEGLEGDPAYFTASWTAWLRVWDQTTVRVLLGAADDAWLLFDQQVAASVAEAPEMEPQGFDIYMDPGQYPVKVLYAHRKATAAGFRFRILGGDVSLCYPDFSEEE